MYRERSASRRARFADALDRLGVWRAIVEARARVRLPWRWLTVLTFHRVTAPDTPGFDDGVKDSTPERFDRQVAFLQRHFTLVDTRDLDAFRAGAPLPSNPALITFDDGYLDNHDVALPILLRHHAKAVFFVATSYISKRRVFWWERVHYLVARATFARLSLSYPERISLPLDGAEARVRTAATIIRVIKQRPGLDVERFLEEIARAAGVIWARDDERRIADALVMTWDHVRGLHAAGMDVQSHTHGHRVLPTMSDEEAFEDLRTSRVMLETALGAPVCALAYPAGQGVAARPGLRKAVERAGYRLALTTRSGATRMHRRVDWLDLPRLTVESNMSEAFFRGCVAVPALAY